MRANTGGWGAEDFFGRENLLASLRRDLATQSVRLEDVRRVGKTWLVKSLAARSDEQMQVVYVDLEGTASPKELHERLYSELGKALPRKSRCAEAIKDFLDAVEGVQVGPIKIPKFDNEDEWPGRLESLLIGYAAAFDTGLSVFVFDELPWAVDAIADRNTGDAEKLLGLLRSIRSRHPNIRMIFCGSIGFHHVIEKLRKQGFTADPLNDMTSVAVGPLSPIEAEQFVEQLFLSEGLSGCEGQNIETYIAELSGGFPFYIQHVVWYLKRQIIPEFGYMREDIDAAFEAVLDSPDENFRFTSYASRLVAYHGEPMATACGTILDYVAQSQTTLSAKELELAMAGNPAFHFSAFRPGGINAFSREAYLGAFRVLEQDRYIVRSPDQLVTFSFQLFQRAWIRMRQL